MAGLPRSGSTLLSSLINQHPDAYASPSTPLLDIMRNTNQFVGSHELWKAAPNEEAMHKIMQDLPRAFYVNQSDKKVIVDKNRAWMNNKMYMDFAGFEFPILTCVRDLDEIAASFIKLVRKNPFKGEGKMNFIDRDLIQQGETEINDFNRCKSFLSENGVVGRCYDSFKAAMEDSETKQHLHLIEYRDLCDNTQEVMDEVFGMFGLPLIKIQKDKIKNIGGEKDFEIYGLEGMHTVKPKIERTTEDPKDILPKEAYDACQGMEFWRNNEERKDNA